jgi:hypothetical protein
MKVKKIKKMPVSMIVTREVLILKMSKPKKANDQ